MAEIKVLSSDVRVGQRVWFSGSFWTVAEIKDGRVYGTGGFTMLGYRAVRPVWLFNQVYGGQPIYLTVKA
jgi:hypothetical protein